MDKYDMTLKFEQMKAFAKTGDYESAARIADEFEWNKLKQNKILSLAASVYGANKEYEKEKEVLLAAYERAPMGRQLAYQLGIVSIRLNELEEAEEYYQDFLDMAPNDTARFVLQYQLEKAKGADITKLISILEELYEEDVEEKWAYQLAVLYARNGEREKALAICDEIVLWFKEGDYVERAKSLRRMLTTDEEVEKQEKEAAAAKEEAETAKQEAAQEASEETAETTEDKAQKEDELKPKEVDASPTKVIGSIPDMIRNFEKKVPEIQLSSQLKLDGDGQISMDIDQQQVEKQITGQLSIDEVLKQLEQQGVLNAETVNGAINVVKEGTGALPKLDDYLNDVPPVEDKAQVKLDVDEAGNLQVQEAEETVIDEDKDVFELGIQDLMSETERKKMQIAKQQAEKEDDVLKLVEELENKAPAEEKTTEDFDIPDASEDGLRLTWEQRQVFKEFLGAPGLENAIARTLKNLVENSEKDGTSRKNNVIIMGEKKSGKTTIAMELIKMANQEMGRKGRKVAKVNGNIINKRGILTAMPRLIGNDLVIEDAGVINSQMMRQMMDTFKGYTGEMIVVLEDEKVTMEHLINTFPFIDEMFSNQILIKEYDIHEWVGYAKAYAKECGYTVDEMGTLALYAKIDEAYGLNRGLERSDVEDIIEDAIEHAQRMGIGKIFNVFSKKSKGELDVLKETDFQ